MRLLAEWDMMMMMMMMMMTLFPNVIKTDSWFLWRDSSVTEYNGGWGYIPLSQVKISADCAGNSLRDLHNSSYHTKAKFNNCFIINSKHFWVFNFLKRRILPSSRHALWSNYLINGRIPTRDSFQSVAAEETKGHQSDTRNNPVYST